MKKTILITMLLAISMFYVGGEASAKVKVAAPSISVTSKTKTSVKLSVKSSNKKMTGYKFYKWNGKKYVKVATKKVSAGKKKVSYTFKSLTKNSSYKFRVTAYRTYKGKTYSASKTKSVKTLKGSSGSNDSGSTNKDNPSVPDFGTDDDPVYTPPEAGWEQKMLDKVNEYRRKEGVPVLVLNQDLCNIALIRCKATYEMLENGNDFETIAHLNSKEYFRNYYRGLGFDYYYLRYENAAICTMGSFYDTWEEMLDTWVNSSGHYATMTTKTKDFTDFGVACYKGVWYQTFEDRNYKIYFADEALWE